MMVGRQVFGDMGTPRWLSDSMTAIKSKVSDKIMRGDDNQFSGLWKKANEVLLAEFGERGRDQIQTG
jgi:hypothetical protein